MTVRHDLTEHLSGPVRQGGPVVRADTAVFHLQGQHDQATHGRNAQGKTIEQVGKTIPEDRATDAVLEEWMSSPEEFAAARKLAEEKARNVPKPTVEQIDKNRAMLETSKRPGGWGRGNSYTRRARAQALFEEFGGKPGGSCPCSHCGIKVAPGGAGGFAAMTQDKIIPAAEGGTYGTVKSGFPNLIPSCGGCNASRNEAPFGSFVAAAGDTVSDRFVAESATGKPVGWDTWLEPEVGSEPVTGPYIVRTVDAGFDTYEQHLIAGETCDPDTIRVLQDEFGADVWYPMVKFDPMSVIDVEVFHMRGRHDQQNHGGGALPDVPFSDVKIAYRPRHPDGKADPGEVVWARVPFEEGDGRSKDRPVLIIGRTKDGKNLVGVQLTSQRGYDRVSVGSGDWDRDSRESFMDTDRFIQVDDSNYRREGAYVKKPKFQQIVDVLTDRQNAPDVDLAHLNDRFAQFAMSSGLIDDWLAGRELTDAEAADLSDWVRRTWLTGDEDVDEALTVVYTRLLETAAPIEQFHANHDQQTHGRRRNGPGAKLARWFLREFQPSGEWEAADVVLALFTLPARIAFPTDQRDPVLLAAGVEVFHLQGQHDQQNHAGGRGAPDRGPAQARALVEAAPPIVKNKPTAEHKAAVEALQSVGRGIYESAYSTLTPEQVSILNGAPTLDPDMFPKEHDAIRRVEQVLAERTMATLRQARPFGRDPEFNASGDPEFVRVVEDAAAMYPKDWFASSYGVMVEPSGTTGGWYEDGRIGLPKYSTTDAAGIPRDTSKKLHRAAVHELGHHLEVVNPNVLKAAQMFLATRKQGAFKRGSSVGVQSNLKVVDGDFRNSYSGVFYDATDIGGSGGTEVLTTHMYSMQFALDGPAEPNWSIQDVSLFAPPRVPGLRDAWLDETYYALGVLASL